MLLIYNDVWPIKKENLKFKFVTKCSQFFRLAPNHNKTSNEIKPLAKDQRLPPGKNNQTVILGFHVIKKENPQKSYVAISPLRVKFQRPPSTIKVEQVHSN